MMNKAKQHSTPKAVMHVLMCIRIINTYIHDGCYLNVTSRLAAFRAAIFLKCIAVNGEAPFFVILMLRVATVYSNYENAIKKLENLTR